MAGALRNGEAFYLTPMGDFPDTFVRFVKFAYTFTFKGVRTMVVFESANGSNDALFTTQRVWVEFDDS